MYSDLRSRKKTLPVTWTVENGGPAGRELAAWLADETRARSATDDELADVARLIDRGGGRAWAAGRRAATSHWPSLRSNAPTSRKARRPNWPRWPAISSPGRRNEYPDMGAGPRSAHPRTTSR